MTRYTPRRRTKLMQDAIIHVFQMQEPPLTVRQIFYALTVMKAIPKTEAGYRQACYYLSVMRENGIVPFGWIADNTRWQIKPRTHTSLDSALGCYAETFRRDLWIDQADYVEIWVEKDALAGVIRPITEKYDVPLLVCRGYASKTFLYEQAEYLVSLDKPAYVYHFGDFDPSGVNAAYNVRHGLIRHGAQIQFRRAAITRLQMDLFDLPTRETKQSDPRARKWGDLPSVELDALPARALRALVQRCIERHLDPSALQRTRESEKADRGVLKQIAANLHPDRSFVQEVS